MKAVLAGFASEAALRRALGGLAAAQIDCEETYTPMPLESQARGSVLPLCMFISGVGGFAGFFVLMSYANLRAYPLDIGGRPEFAWPPYIPIAFELGVLCAMVVGFLGFFALCRMPSLYEPIDECASFREASRSGWFLSVRSADPERLSVARRVLEEFAPASIEEFAE